MGDVVKLIRKGIAETGSAQPVPEEAPSDTSPPMMK
jgi:hypothetical protein